MSGYSEYSNGPKDPALSHIAILQKPFSRPSLVRKIHEMLSGQPVDPVEALKRS
jgi:hypothetical protein